MTIKIKEVYLVSISTTWYGPTDHRGSRIKATAGKGRTVWVNCQYGRDEHDHDDHDHAALKLMDKMGWNWDLLKASNPEGGRVYIKYPEAWEGKPS